VMWLEFRRVLFRSRARAIGRAEAPRGPPDVPRHRRDRCAYPGGAFRL